MGMFDRIYDATGREWQTKAFDCNLDTWVIGDTITADCAASYQVEVISSDGSSFRGDFRLTESLATVRDNVVVAVPDDRDPSLPLVAYSGGLLEIGGRP
jgi:hypothetical protein